MVRFGIVQNGLLRGKKTMRRSEMTNGGKSHADDVSRTKKARKKPQMPKGAGSKTDGGPPKADRPEKTAI
jgi:hypothetical protein